MTDIPPCQMCGSPVRVVQVPGERSIMDTTAPMVPRRICTNPKCPSKTSERSVADVV